jgi:hypothetical protein
VSTEGLAGLLQRAAQQERDWRTVTVRLPESASGPVSFAIDRGDGGQPQLRSTLTLDRAGAVVRYEAFADQGAGRRLRSLMRFAHTARSWARGPDRGGCGVCWCRGSRVDRHGPGSASSARMAVAPALTRRHVPSPENPAT